MARKKKKSLPNLFRNVSATNQQESSDAQEEKIEIKDFLADFQNTFMRSNDSLIAALRELSSVAVNIADSISDNGGMIDILQKIHDELVTLIKKNTRQQLAQAEASAEAQRERSAKGGFISNARVEGGKSFGKSFGDKFGKLAGGGLGIAAIGVGLAGFLTAMAGAGAAIRLFGDGEGLAELMGNLAEGIQSFSGEGFLRLSALLGTGALFGAVTGVKTKAGAALGMTAIGLGLAGFFSGLAVGEAAIKAMGSDGGASIRNMMMNIAEGLEAFSGSGFAKFSALLGAGALFGAFAGPVASGLAAVGMTAIGLGLGGFLAGIAVGESALKFLGADGSGIKSIMVNIADGLTALSNLDGEQLSSLVGPMFKLGPAMLALTTFGAGVGAIDGVVSGISKAWNWITGGDPNDKSNNKFAKIVEMLSPLKGLNADEYNGLIKISEAIQNFSTGMSTLQTIDVEAIRKNVDKLMGVVPIISGSALGMSPSLMQNSTTASSNVSTTNARDGVVTQADRSTEGYKTIYDAIPTMTDDRLGDAQRIQVADKMYIEAVRSGKITRPAGRIETTIERVSIGNGARIDRSSREAASAFSSNVIVAPSSTSVNAPTVNTSNSTTMAPASPRPNSNGVCNFFVDPILGM